MWQRHKFFTNLNSNAPEAHEPELLLELGHQASLRLAGGSETWGHLVGGDLAISIKIPFSLRFPLSLSLFYSKVSFFMHRLSYQDL